MSDTPFSASHVLVPVEPTREMTIAGSWKYDVGSEAADAVYRAMIAAAPTSPTQVAVPGWRPTHRHVKRGSTYQVIGLGEVQCPDDFPLTDYEVVVIYQGSDGCHWVRRKSEFNDGRFEALAAAPTSPTPASREAKLEEALRRISLMSKDHEHDLFSATQVAGAALGEKP